MLFLDSKLQYSGQMGIFGGATGMLGRAGTVACIFFPVIKMQSTKI